MTGLLIKDLKLMRGQKNFFLVVFVVLIMMELFSEEGSFTTVFLTFIVSLFSISTISYDEFDNGYEFLFSLPISRRQYVLEKYLLGLGLGVSAFLFATGISLLLNTMSLQESLLLCLGVFPLLLALQAIYLPLYLKFGQEKGRIAIIVVLAVLFLGANGIFSLIQNQGIGLIWLYERYYTLISWGIALVVMLGWFISMRISTKIMEKKEF